MTTVQQPQVPEDDDGGITGGDGAVHGTRTAPPPTVGGAAKGSLPRPRTESAPGGGAATALGERGKR
ncbi:MAG: hypothetical protein ACRDP3_26515, partial [Streptomyces sp.]|uniref:hypothetical protein n=1 Tax=Streptomyces sp. TaxID=1931 RepID=UPI003D6BCC48